MMDFDVCSFFARDLMPRAKFQRGLPCCSGKRRLYGACLDVRIILDSG
ncbi:MAG: hypothetical protein JRF35_12395 [Deltaproteobacteria bacterium]|nr:hypothetical protein [Deltaproteobacteria bacterium]